MDQPENETPKEDAHSATKFTNDGLFATIAIACCLVGLPLMFLCCGGLSGGRTGGSDFERQYRLESERDAKLDRLREITEEGTRPGVTSGELDRLREEVRRMPVGPSD
jgi:hypothetical protein